MTTFADLLFANHLDEALADPDAGRWGIKRQGDATVLHVTLSPQSVPNEMFLARLGWDTYPPTLPASVIFLDPETEQKGPKPAWPNLPGVRAPDDFCACWTAEGYVAHPEWLRDPNMQWAPGENPILTQLRYVQLELDYHYNGRCHD